MASRNSTKTVILTGDQFTATRFRVTGTKSDPRTGRKKAYLNADVRNVKIRSPILRVPFPTKVQHYTDGQPKASVVVSFDNVNPDEANYNADTAAFMRENERIDDLLVKRAAFDDPVNYIGRELTDMTEEQKLTKARQQQTRGVKEGRMNDRTGKRYSSTMKFKLYLNADGNPADVVACVKYPGQSRSPLQPEDIIPLLQAGSRVRVTYRYGAVWFKRQGRLCEYGLPRIVERLEIFPFQRKVIDAAKFTVSRLQFSDNLTNNYGSPTVRVSYLNDDGESQRVIFRVRGTIKGNRDGDGIERWTDSVNKDYARWNMDGHTSDADTRDLLTAIQEVENKLRELAVERSDSWFGQKKKTDEIDEHFIPIARRIGDLQGTADMHDTPFLKLKLPQYSNASGTSTYRARFKDRDGTIIEGDEIAEIMHQGVTAAAVFQMGSVYIMNRGQFGLPLEALEVQVDTTLAEVRAEGGDVCQDNTTLFGPDIDAAITTPIYDDDDADDVNHSAWVRREPVGDSPPRLTRKH